MSSIAQFIFLFFLLCLSIILFIIVYNIFTKSYRPTKALMINLFILIVFSVNGILGLLAVGNLFSFIEKSGNFDFV